MSKYQLVINSDDPNEVSALLAALGSSTAMPAVQIAPLSVGASNIANGGAPGSMSSDDDEDGNTGNDAPADPNSLDKNGLPWDDRIHSTPAALTEKGVWRAKRGVGKDKAFVAQVEAELRNRGQQPQQMQPVQQPVPVPQYQPPMPQPQPVAQPVSAPFDPAQQFQPVHQQPIPMQQPQQQFTQPPIQQQPVPVQQPQYTPQPIPSMDFNAFMQKIQYLLQQRDAAGNAFIDAAYLQTVTAQIGREFQVQINAITDIMNNQQMIDRAVQIMASAGKWM